MEIWEILFIGQPKPYEEGQDFHMFIQELKKIPDFDKKFQELVSHNSKWINLALATLDDKGFHVNFFINYQKLKGLEAKSNELSLENFHKDTPTIMVTVFN